ncbi:DUF11 domain-containing protein [Candidatus Woesearchaeota archaeon]|nr:DUF11 domain-containing protein [Candidatus Woesearchaeota archaeon]
MKKFLLIFVFAVLSTSVSAYYAQNGTWEGRTRIDEVGGQATNGVWEAERYTGGMHPVTANFNAPYTGYIGAFDLLVTQPNLTVTKNGTPDPVVSEQLLNYTITITNNGGKNATNVTAVDTYDGGVSFVTSSPLPSVSNNTWNLGVLTPGQTVTINITVNVTVVGPANITNFVNVSYTNTTGTAYSSAANTTTAVVAPNRPLITVTKTDTPDPVSQGGQIHYTITLTNIGGLNATNVTVNDTYPAGVTYNNASPAPTTGNNFWALGNITVGQTVTVNITVNVFAGSGTLVNRVNVDYQNTTGANFTTNTSATTTIRTTRGGGGGGGGSAGMAGYMNSEATYKVEQDLEQIEVKYGDTISYVKDGVEHLLYVNAITRNGVQFLVDEGVEYSIPLHGEGLFDLDTDKMADLRMLVNEISTNRALLSVYKLYKYAEAAFASIGMTDAVEIHENVVDEAVEAPDMPEQESPAMPGVIKKGISIKYAYLIPFVLVAILMLALFLTRHKRPPEYRSTVEDINAKIEKLNETLKQYRK